MSVLLYRTWADIKRKEAPEPGAFSLGPADGDPSPFPTGAWDDGAGMREMARLGLDRQAQQVLECLKREALDQVYEAQPLRGAL